MDKPNNQEFNGSKIIGISGVASSGKTALCKALGKEHNAVVVLWDDYEKNSKEPSDYKKWFDSEKNYDEWQYDSLVRVLKDLKKGKSIICPITGKEVNPTKYIFFEAPLGRKHHSTGTLIDSLIYLEIEPDIALARRLIRIYKERKNAMEIISEIENYLNFERDQYLFSHNAKKDSDFIINAGLPIELQIEKVIIWLNLKTAVADGQECQDFDSESLTQGVDIPKR